MLPTTDLMGTTKVHRSLSVVIPAYNEAERLPETVRDIHAFLVAGEYDAEIIVVDDGSLDQTLKIARGLVKSCPLLRVLGYAPNRGKGSAVKTGVLAATKTAVLFSDADHSTPISDIDRFWPSYDRGCKVVIGSRKSPDSHVAVPQPAHRRLIGRAFGFITSILAIRGIQDTQCGFKLFEARAAKCIFRTVNTIGFAFDIEVLMRARQMGLKISELGVHWANAEDSRVDPLRDSVLMLRDVLRMQGILF